MIPFAVLYETFSFLDTLVRAVGLDEGMRILEGKTEFLSARIQDIEGALLSASTQQVKKRKREDDLLIWMSKGHALEQKARKLLGDGDQVLSEKKRKSGEGRISFQRYAKLVDVHKLNETLSAHEKEADILLGCGLFDVRGPDRGNLIPVGDLLGQVASDGLQQLQALLLDDNVGRIAIQGIEGIGKTFLMKHLHNSALKWVEGFYYNFWITCPRQFSIRHVQDAVAAAVKCDLPCDGDLNLRAKKLSDTLTGLGSFVIYLDGIPDVQLSLVQIGIPVPAKGSKSKLVITTRSTCVSKILDCCRTVKIDSLSDIEASQLFRNEARISMTSTSSSLAKMCHGVPRRIVDIATHMCGIDDPCEWRNARFELRNLEKGDKLPY